MEDIIKIVGGAALGYALAKNQLEGRDGEDGSVNSSAERDIIIIDRHLNDNNIEDGVFYIPEDDSDPVVTSISGSGASGDLQYEIEKTVYRIIDSIKTGVQLSEEDDVLYQKYKDEFDRIASNSNLRHDTLMFIENEDWDGVRSSLYELGLISSPYVDDSDLMDAIASFVLEYKDSDGFDAAEAQDVVRKIYYDIMNTKSDGGDLSDYGSIIGSLADAVETIRKNSQLQGSILDDEMLNSFEFDSSSAIVSSNGAYLNVDDSTVFLVRSGNSIINFQTDRHSDVDHCNKIIHDNQVPGCFYGLDFNVVANVGSYVSVNVPNFVYQDDYRKSSFFAAGDKFLIDINAASKLIICNANFEVHLVYKFMDGDGRRIIKLYDVPKNPSSNFCGVRVVPENGIGVDFARGVYETQQKKKKFLCGSKTITIPHVAYTAYERKYILESVLITAKEDGFRFGVFEE